MFVAVYQRYGITDYEYCQGVGEAIEYLLRGETYGELYPICVYRTSTGVVDYRHRWPDGKEMTEEDVKPYVEEVKRMRIPLTGLLDQIQKAINPQ